MLEERGRSFEPEFEPTRRSRKQVVERVLVVGGHEIAIEIFTQRHDLNMLQAMFSNDE